MTDKRHFIAKNVVSLLKKGDLVNLGAGIPFLITEYIDQDSEIMIQSECGTIGAGPKVTDPDKIIRTLIAPDTSYASLKEDGLCFDSQTAFGMIRGGFIDVTILGAMQVDRHGSMANWDVPGKALKGMGGAMDLCIGARCVIVAMEHCARDGRSKIMEECTYPLTCKEEVNYIVTEYCVLETVPEGLKLIKLAKGYSAQDVQNITDCQLIIPEEIPEMEDEWQVC